MTYTEEARLCAEYYGMNVREFTRMVEKLSKGIVDRSTIKFSQLVGSKPFRSSLSHTDLDSHSLRERNVTFDHRLVERDL